MLRDVEASDAEHVILLEPDNRHDQFAVKIEVAERNDATPSEPIV